MKRLIKAYTSFSRTERMGIMALSILLLLLIVVRATMHLWMTTTPATNERLAAASNSFKHTQATPASANADTSHTYNRAVTTAPIGTLFTFDPNTLDSAGFRRLGLREKSTAILLHWRAKGKVFYHKEELKKVYTLLPEEYDRIAPYVRIHMRQYKGE